MKTINGSILNFSTIWAVLFNLALIYLMANPSYSTTEFVTILFIINLFIYIFIYESYNVIFYNSTEIVIRNKINPLVFQLIPVEDIIKMEIKGSYGSTILLITLVNGKKEKIIIKGLPQDEVEEMIKELGF